MNDTQHANLKKLADYLAKGNTEKIFNMEEFCTGSYENYDDETIALENYDCGTAACAMGHGPAAGIKPFLHEDWWDYSRRAFGIDQSEMDAGFDAFQWMFSSVWAHIDNTPQGAAARIYWFLDHGEKVPEDYLEQRNGGAPLCYSVVPFGWDRV